MANGVNLVQVGGNLGDNPKVNYTQSGTCVMNLSIGCNDTYIDNRGQKQETVEWVRCVVWGKRAEALSKFLRKGAWVLVEGSLKTTKYTDREGVARWKTEVVAKNVFLGGSDSSRGNAQRSRRQGRDPERRGASRRDDDDGYDSRDQGGGGGGGYDDTDYGSGGGDDEIPFARITSGAREPWWRWQKDGS